MDTRVRICDVGPRDGFQFEGKPIPTELKLEIIRGLFRAGVPTVQVTSFVHPGKVPQMADAEQVVAALSEEELGMSSGLALNVRGVKRAADAGLRQVDLSIATNETHGRDNAGMSIDEGVAQASLMLQEAERAGLAVQLGLQTVFGYSEPGDTPLERVLGIVERLCERSLESISIADTTGLANPGLVRKTVSAIREKADHIPIVLHLHDTRGLGLINVAAALDVGVRRFDTSLGGLGGCPFIPGAAGNIPTEEVVYLCSVLGYQTGVDASAVAVQSRRLATFLDRELAGKLYALL